MDEFERALGGQSMPEAAIQAFRSIVDSREDLAKYAERFVLGHKDPEAAAALTTAVARLLNASQIVVQESYFRATGRYLDLMEADDPGGGGPPSPE